MSGQWMPRSFPDGDLDPKTDLDRPGNAITGDMNFGCFIGFVAIEVQAIGTTPDDGWSQMIPWPVDKYPTNVGCNRP